MSKRIYVDKIDPQTVLKRLGGDRAKLRELARKAGLAPDLLDQWVAGKVRLSAGDQAKIAQLLG